MRIDATDLLADSQPLFDEALVTVHRFRPELVQVDATVDLLLANQARRRWHRRKDLWGDHGTAGGRGRVGRQRPLEPVPGGPIKLG